MKSRYLILLTMVGVAGLASAAQASEEWHPFLGNTIIGQSAEVITLAPTTFGSLGLRSIDLKPDASTPVPGSQFLISGTAGCANLDIACGDFDGDAHDEAVAVYSIPTQDPGVHEIWLVFPEIGATPLNWLSAAPLRHGDAVLGIPPDTNESPSLLHIVPGNFDLDNNTELALAYRGTDARIHLDLIETDDSGMPVPLATTIGEELTDALGPMQSARFALSTGDFNGDAIDEIVVYGVLKVNPEDPSDPWMELFVDVYALEAGELVRKNHSTDPRFRYDWEYRERYENNWVWNSWGDRGQGVYIDRMVLDTGHLRSGEMRDYIVLGFEQRNGHWSRHDTCYPFGCWKWKFEMDCYFHLITLRVDAPKQGDWVVTWGENEVTMPSLWSRLSTHNGEPWNQEFTGYAMGLDVGDINPGKFDPQGGGTDEVVWVARDQLMVYESDTLDNLGVPQLAEVANTTVPKPYPNRDPSSKIVQITDIDLDPVSAQWTPEVVLQDWDASASPARMRVRTLEPSLDENQEIVDLVEASFFTDPSIEFEIYSDLTTICADLDGDAVRLGTPVKYRFTDVIQPLVVVNTPPVHFDVLDDQAWDVCGCYESGDCPCFYSRYADEQSSGVTMSTQFHSDWGVGYSVKGRLGIPGFGSYEFSIESMFGKHFARTGEMSQTIEIGQSVPTEGWPKMKATSTDYDFWEYPVYVDAEFAGYTSVARPISVSETTWLQYPNWPSQDFPIASDPSNILSYRSVMPTVEDSDIERIWYAPPAFDVSPPLKRECASFWMRWEDVENNAEERSWEISFEKKGGPSGSYARGELNTQTTTVTDAIALFGSKGNLAAGLSQDATYTVAPFIYRASNGALVLDYVTSPSQDGVGPETFWDLHYSNPDPAFVLPYLYYDEHAWPFAGRQHETPDIRLEPRRVVPGALPDNLVTITATIHNFSLSEQVDPVEVSFYVGDPDNGGRIIEGTDGRTVWSTLGGIAPRDAASVQIFWRPFGQPGIPENPQIYAVIDPANLIVGETHDVDTNRSNNKGYVTLFSPGGLGIGGEQEDPGDEGTPVFLTRLGQNVPNPFNPRTTIRYTLAGETSVRLRILDLMGRRVHTLLDGVRQPAGEHLVQWDGTDENGHHVAAGTYLYRLETDHRVQVKKMVLLK